MPLNLKFKMVKAEWDKLAILISLLSATFSFWTYMETKESRLEARRSVIRNDYLTYLNDAKYSKHILDCYDSFNGQKRPSRTEFENLIFRNDTSIRKKLVIIHKMPEETLDLLEDQLNRTKDSINSMFSQEVINIKITWDKEKLEKADLACKGIK